MKKDLWLRLKLYHFDNLVPTHLLDHVAAAFGGRDASTKAFASKLSRKLGWTTSFAHQVIGEYRKFLYLGVVSDFPVTPSKVIDKIWHEHLLFSRAYREFCRDVLRQDFDHNPELVPFDDQTSVFRAQYEATLALYAAEFNMQPPEAIWGRPKFSIDDVERSRPGRTEQAGDRSTTTGGDAPLYALFDGSGGHGADSHAGMAEFGGGGGFTGGGGGSSWSDSATHSASDPGATSDAGSSGDGGGSGCSSGCGGGGE